MPDIYGELSPEEWKEYSKYKQDTIDTLREHIQVLQKQLFACRNENAALYARCAELQALIKMYQGGNE